MNGRNVRKYYQRRLPSNPSSDYYFMLRDTKNAESVIIEYGFLDNEVDANLLKNNYLEYAEFVVKSICEYLGVPYKQEVTNDNYYIVVKGDTLYGIAKKYGITVDKLKDINNLTSNNLAIGQKLLINKNEVNDDYYVVKKGDTLYGIAKLYNTTVSEIKKLNNLSSDMLSIGMKLLIPVSNMIYTVQKGDSLYSIAKRFNTTVNSIMTANNLTSTLLSIGQKLVIK